MLVAERESSSVLLTIQEALGMYQRPRITSVMNVGDSMEFNGRCSG